jgi:hypothetical protein
MQPDEPHDVPSDEVRSKLPEHDVVLAELRRYVAAGDAALVELHVKLKLEADSARCSQIQADIDSLRTLVAEARTDLEDLRALDS